MLCMAPLSIRDWNVFHDSREKSVCVRVMWVDWIWIARYDSDSINSTPLDWTRSKSILFPRHATVNNQPQPEHTRSFRNNYGLSSVYETDHELRKYLQDELNELETLSEETHRGTPPFLSEYVFLSTFCWCIRTVFSSDGVVNAVTAIPLLQLLFMLRPFMRRGDFGW